MFTILMRWSKVFITAGIVIITCDNFTNAADFANFFETANYIKVKNNLPEDNKRNNIIKNIASTKDIPFIDFSESNINDNDIRSIAEGLAIREYQHGNKIGLKFLDISSGITKSGIKELLIFFQDGFNNEDLKLKGNGKVYPDVRQLILKINDEINTTEKFLEELGRRAPSVFSGNLQIVN